MESTNTESTRRVLLERLDTLLGREHRVEEHLRAPLAADSEEQALALEGSEVLEQIGTSARAEIEDIRSALGRIDDGTYGVCSKCGDDIAVGRLRAMPATLFCVRCAD